jgi:hypothetical protein
MAFRRLKKTAWLLQYENSYHHLFFNDAKDYTLRLTQFFDHYLKDSPAPYWMTNAALQNESNFLLDKSGRCYPNCKICKMWNIKID